MEIYATASLKGGVGKTTTCIFVAQALVFKGKKVLVCDLDPNNNLTDYFLRNESVESITSSFIGHVLEGSLPIKQVIRKTDFGVDIIPACIKLARTARDLSHDPSSILRFQLQLKSLDYDYIFLDTPPHLSFTFTAGIYVADKIICPRSLNRWSKQGSDEVYDEIKTIANGQPKIVLNVPSQVSGSEAKKLPYLAQYKFTKSYVQSLKEVEKAAVKGIALDKDESSWAQFMELAEELMA